MVARCITSFRLECTNLVQNLILLAGDVEQKPGPLSAAQEQQVFDGIMTIPSMQQTRAEIIDKGRSIRSHQPLNKK